MGCHCLLRMEYYSAIENNEIMLFAATWMDVESVILSEVSQKEKNKYCTLMHIHALKIGMLLLLLLLLSRFSRVRLCATPETGSPPGSPVPGILQARTLSGLPFPSPMHESEKRK